MQATDGHAVDRNTLLKRIHIRAWHSEDDKCKKLGATCTFEERKSAGTLPRRLLTRLLRVSGTSST